MKDQLYFAHISLYLNISRLFLGGEKRATILLNSLFFELGFPVKITQLILGQLILQLYGSQGILYVFVIHHHWNAS
jgi:hypothetical protein